MPRSKKTLKPQTTSMEAGASYGEVSENIQAQNAAPLPNNRMPVDPALTNQTSPEPPSPVGPPPLPVESARQFIPEVTPLSAPSNGVAERIDRAPIKRQMSAMMLTRWAEATGDHRLADAANQLRNIQQ